MHLDRVRWDHKPCKGMHTRVHVKLRPKLWPFYQKRLSSISCAYEKWPCCFAWTQIFCPVDFSVVNCQPLSAPVNGNITGSGLSPQSKRSFSCNTGYTLQGSENRTCQDDGQWSGTNTTCASKAFLCTRTLIWVDNGSLLLHTHFRWFSFFVYHQFHLLPER